MAKTVIITGLSSGIGAATAKKFYKEGYNVVGFSRNLEKQRKVANKHEFDPNRSLLIKGDVTKEEDVKNAVKQTIKAFKKIDVLVNNAGFGKFGIVEELELKDFEEQFSVNVFGVFLMTKHVLKHMKERDEGQIIMISSMAGKNHFKGGTAYASTKWALQGFTGCLKTELRPTKIKVGTILPGSVDTAFFDEVGMSPNPKRCLKPSDISRQIYNLANQDKHSDIDEIIVRPAHTPEEK